MILSLSVYQCDYQASIQSWLETRLLDHSATKNPTSPHFILTHCPHLLIWHQNLKPLLSPISEPAWPASPSTSPPTPSSGEPPLPPGWVWAPLKHKRWELNTQRPLASPVRSSSSTSCWRCSPPVLAVSSLWLAGAVEDDEAVDPARLTYDLSWKVIIINYIII